MKSHYITLFCLLLSCCAVFGQEGECEESELGYACKKQMTDYYALHWSLGPTTQGADAEEGEIAIAMVAETEGWVGFAFAEEPGQMAPADFVVGYVDGEDVSVTAYRSEEQSLTRQNIDDSVTLRDVRGRMEETNNTMFTIIQFIRDLSEGTTEIVLDEEIPVNVAMSPSDTLAYHGLQDRQASSVTLSLASAGSTEEPDVEDDDGATTCTPSSLDYACMMEAGLVTVHWTTGPFDGEGSVPELAEGEIAMAISAETTGYVAVSFAQEPGLMAPANVILGWVDDAGATINAYDISEQDITPDDQSDEIGMTPRGGTEEDGTTTIEFVLDGTFTFPVDLEETVDMNWAVGEGDELFYHGFDNKGSFTVDFFATPSADIATEEEPEEEEPVEEEPEEEEPEEEEEELATGEQNVLEDASMSPSGDGCALSPLDYQCMSILGEVTVHWTLGPAAASGSVLEVDEGEVAMAISAATTGYVAVSFAQAPGSMAPADVILGWVNDAGATINAYDITERDITSNDRSDEIGMTPRGGVEEDGVTTIEFVLNGTFTFDVDFQQTLDMNWAIAPDDSLIRHTRRGSSTINLLSGASTEESRTLKYYKAHGACMVIAWIGLAPLGVLVARNKYVFKIISDGAWFQIHRAVQITALLSMICGLIVALVEFSDPATVEGKRHRRVGISIVTIGLVQGFIPFFRPHPDGTYRYIFNYVHWWLGRGAVVLGIATVFLGIEAYDILNEKDVDAWWITSVAILGVYFILASLGEFRLAYTAGEDIRMRPSREAMEPPPVAGEVEMS